MPERERRCNGWGFEGESFCLPEATRAWLQAGTGEGDALPAVAEAEVGIPAARSAP